MHSLTIISSTVQKPKFLIKYVAINSIICAYEKECDYILDYKTITFQRVIKYVERLITIYLEIYFRNYT